mmetsp:Transcript_31606/g.56565  ORF Transcript_31606/g.56565 Transcript_31606/m.56565 type:complete len:329 (-) Transcript_31606:351-1337(-)
MMAMSELGSRNGSTGPVCLVKITRPSRKGGLVSWTSSTVFTSESLSKSKSTSCSRATPDVNMRFSSHAFMSLSSSLARLLCASVITLPSRRVIFFCNSELRFWKNVSSPTNGFAAAPSSSCAPPSSWSYQLRSSCFCSSSHSARALAPSSVSSPHAPRPAFTRSGLRSTSVPDLCCFSCRLQEVDFHVGVSAGEGSTVSKRTLLRNLGGTPPLPPGVALAAPPALAGVGVSPSRASQAEPPRRELCCLEGVILHSSSSACCRSGVDASHLSGVPVSPLRLEEGGRCWLPDPRLSLSRARSPRWRPRSRSRSSSYSRRPRSSWRRSRPS